MDVVVVNHNTCRLLAECLQSLSGQGAERVIVVDSGSLDGSRAVVRERFPEARLVEAPRNVGFGAGANLGVRESRAGSVLILNADTSLRAGALARLRDHLSRHPRTAVAGPKLFFPDGRMQRSARRFPGTAGWIVDNHTSGPWLARVPVLRNRLLNSWDHSSNRGVDWVIGAAFAIRRSAFDQVLGFDESYFMYFEEVDLCWRLKSAGWRTEFVHEAEVVHVGGASAEQRRGEMEVQYLSSAMRFFRSRYSAPRVAVCGLLLRLDLLAKIARCKALLKDARGTPDELGYADQLDAYRGALAGLSALSDR